MNRISELEGAVLGIVREEGSCTAYAVRRTFLTSLSPQWSGSAGAIYPLMSRLERRGILRSRSQEGSSRGGRLYSLTPLGLRLLRAWLAPPMPEWVTGVPPDALRTRLRFLATLEPRQRSAFLAAARAGVERHIRAVRGDCRATRNLPDPLRHLVARGALLALQARRRWLGEAARRL